MTEFNPGLSMKSPHLLMKMKISVFVIIISAVLTTVYLPAKEYHVSAKSGCDLNAGTETAPFKTIQKAANIAVPGDTITIHAGVYREAVNPLRGGSSETDRIVYQAAGDGVAHIKGSEVVKGWEHLGKGIWKISINDAFFGNYNPYKTLIEGDWFKGEGRIHHTGEVFLNSKSLYEKETLEKILSATELNPRDPDGSKYVWYCEGNGDQTTITANFQGLDPNVELVEITTRSTCFYPTREGVDYITIRGLHFSQAATQWAAPTAEQIGMIATNWNKGWIIENNIVRDAKCSGITLGKERGTGHNTWLANPKKAGALHYIETIFNALRKGWNKSNIGSHIVRNNVIFNCEQAGICGSMGAAFSHIEGNHVYDIWTKRQFKGAEIAGIKFHGAIDTVIKKNRIHDSSRGLWLDWMTQGTIVIANILHDNDSDDIFVEVNHGPFVVANNIMLSPRGLINYSDGGAYMHNLITGLIVSVPNQRFTPYHLPHSTEVMGLARYDLSDNRFLNNLFAPNAIGDKDSEDQSAWGLNNFNGRKPLCAAISNLYLNGAEPYDSEVDSLSVSDFNPDVKIEDAGGSVYLHITMPDVFNDIKTSLVTSDRLPAVWTSGLPFENPDGSKILLDEDYWGNKRSCKPTPGPFENLRAGHNKIQVW